MNYPTLRRGLGFALFLAYSTLTACASQPLGEANDQFHSGQYVEALQTLDEADDKISDRDKLLVLMHKGLIQHHLGQYAKSANHFLQAAVLIEELEQISISELASTLAVNEWLAAYQGEYSEQLWVHTYQMMNYLLLKRNQSAAVEARRALKVFEKYAGSLQDAWFTRALIAISFDSVGLLNDAYLEYKILAQSMPEQSAVADILYHHAIKLGFDEDAANFKKSIPDSIQAKNKGNMGELVLFVAEGRIPEKISGNIFLPPDIRISWPEYRRSYAYTVNFTIKDDHAFLPHMALSSNLASLASTSLSDRGKTIAVKQIARIGVKRSVVNEVEDKNPLAGGILQILLFALEEADTRGWDTLPKQLTMLRIPLPVGSHNIRIIDDAGLPSERELAYFPGVIIKSRQRVFQKIRF